MQRLTLEGAVEVGKVHIDEQRSLRLQVVAKTVSSERLLEVDVRVVAEEEQRYSEVAEEDQESEEQNIG